DARGGATPAAQRTGRTGDGMSLDESVKSEITGLITSHDVVLFMKGNRRQPQCGFSATVVGILDGLLPDYRTVDVLSAPHIREGIKIFSSWPTIPQLYVKGEFVGGCDIVQEMFASGELFETLGVAAPSTSRPTIHVSPAARRALEAAIAQHGSA